MFIVAFLFSSTESPLLAYMEEVSRYTQQLAVSGEAKDSDYVYQDLSQLKGSVDMFLQLRDDQQQEEKGKGGNGSEVGESDCSSRGGNGSSFSSVAVRAGRGSLSGASSRTTSPAKTPRGGVSVAAVFLAEEGVSPDATPRQGVLGYDEAEGSAVLVLQRQQELMKAFAEKGWKHEEIKRLAAAGPSRGRVWNVLHELLAQGWSELEVCSFLSFCKMPLSFDSFLDERMRVLFEDLPAHVAQHARNALRFICFLFSQIEFDKIFERVASSLLVDLEEMDNSSRDGGCQDRALFFTEFVSRYQVQLHEKRYGGIPPVLKNFVVLNYLLGCCQNRYGRDSFLNFPYPEQMQNFRIDPWLKDCISPEKLRFLTVKSMDGPSAQIAAAVSVLNKLFFMSKEQLTALGSSQSFAVQIARATHKSSFDTMRQRLESNTVIPIDLIWTHISAEASGVARANYRVRTLGEISGIPLARHRVQLFSFHASEVEASALEERVKTKSDLFAFLNAWAIRTDSFMGGQQQAFHDLPGISFSTGVLNRTSALDKLTSKDKLVGVGHIFPASMVEGMTMEQLLASYKRQDDLRKPFSAA